MNPDEIITFLQQLAEATSNVAMDKTTSKGSRARLTLQASVLLDAADLIVQLQDRLVRQACYFERIEAAASPKTWPLLEPEEDDDDPGIAL